MRILISFVAYLTFHSLVLGEPGFHSLSEKGTPDYIKKAGEATYRYVLLAEPAYTYPAKDYEYLLKNLGTGFVDMLVRKQVLECQKLEMANCSFPYAGSGTAFVIGKNRDQLMTVRHNLEVDIKKYMDHLSSEAGKEIHIYVGKDEPTLMRNMRLHFLLYNKNNEIVFDTRNSDDFARPYVMGFGEMVNWVKAIHGESTVDFVLIDLNRPVGDIGLEFREDRVKPGEKITVLGYPRATNTRALLDKEPDSDGNSFYYSRGEVFSAADVFQFMTGPRYIADADRDAKIEETILYGDTEAVNGFSGGPVLDTNGLVVGVLIADWAISHPAFYTPKNAIYLHSEWLLKNIAKYKP